MNVIIVGCGRMGAELAHLLNLRGHQVSVVDNDPTSFERLGASFHGRTLVGIGFDHDVLLEAGIEQADGLAALTVSDEVNAVAARIASRLFHVPTVVARLYDPRNAEIFRRLGIRTVSPVSWAVQRMADLLSYTYFDSAITIGSGAQIVEVNVSTNLAEHTVEQITAMGEFHVVAVTRGGETFLPLLGTILRAGDTIHVIVLAASTERFQALVDLA